MMKNKILFIAILFFGLIGSVKGYTTTNAECLDSGTCIVLCNYKNYGNMYSKTYYITIYYYLKDGNFAVGYSDNMKGPGLFNDVFSSNKRVFSKGYSSASTFTCPKNAYYDRSGLEDEVCFDDDGSWCINSKSNIGTDFSLSSQREKDADFEEDLTYYFENWSSGDVTVDDFLNGNIQSGEDILNKIVNNDLVKNYLRGYSLPDFMYNSDAYQNGSKKITEKYNSMKKTWLNELAAKKANGSITEEEYNNAVNIINESGEYIEENADDTLSNVNTSSTTSNLDIKTVNMCSSNSTSLLVFQVIGYFILIIKILVPLIIIILGSIDLGKAAISSDEKLLNENFKKLVRRIITGVIIFFIPTILDFGLSLIEGVSDVMSKYKGCTSCILNPTNKNKCNPTGLDGTKINDTRTSGGGQTDGSGAGRNTK